MGVILDAHRERVETQEEGPDGFITVVRPGEPLPDAPVWFYKPLNPREKIRWSSDIFAEQEIGRMNLRYLDLVNERLIRVENFEIGDEPFDKSNQLHMDSIEPEQLVELGMEILTSASLSKEELGK